ncbi:MAG: hypothetical protein H6935_09590 [Thiobacillus sp.]|nr:hypothetical protein [Thiobacillus sp.]
MIVVGILSLALAVMMMILAVTYQRRDITPGRGGTMGGEMTAGLIWLVASALCALAALVLLRWYWAVLAFVLTLGLSFMVRILLARIG